MSSAKSAQQKPQRPSNWRTIVNLLLLIIIIAGLFFVFRGNNVNRKSKTKTNLVSKFAQIINKNIPTNSPNPIIKPSPSPSPTPRPLTFDEMNKLYGPCVRLPTLMYHHVQSKEMAIAKKQTGLTVYTDVFKTQMEYLKNKGYNMATMSDLINFFDDGASIPTKSVLITFDDGYKDFFTDAYPILSDISFHSTIYIPTGLMQNPEYLTWDEIRSMNPWVVFGNHTWSHKSVVTQEKVMMNEISTADTQLSDHGLNNPKTFAYPYGPENINAENYLNSLGYKLAFTTRPGNILCKKQRLNLPRIRVGNNPLSNYGF